MITASKNDPQNSCNSTKLARIDTIHATQHNSPRHSVTQHNLFLQLHNLHMSERLTSPDVLVQAWLHKPVIDLNGPHPFAQPLACRAHLKITHICLCLCVILFLGCASCQIKNQHKIYKISNIWRKVFRPGPHAVKSCKFRHELVWTLLNYAAVPIYSDLGSNCTKYSTLSISVLGIFCMTFTFFTRFGSKQGLVTYL